MANVLRAVRDARPTADEIDRVRRCFAAWGDETMLTEVEAAIAIGLSRSWLRQARQRGAGPRHVIVAGVIRFRAGDIRAWLRGQAEGASAPSRRGGRRAPTGAAANAAV